MSKDANGGSHKSLLSIREHELARDLIRQGLRIAAIQSLLQHVYRTELSRIWREVFPGESPPAGRLPSGSASVIKTPLDSALAAFMLNEYLVIAVEPDLRVDIEALSAAWESCQDFLGGRNDYANREIRLEFYNINSLWLLARDYLAQKVQCERCQNCGSMRVRCIDWDIRSKLQRCPHCTLREMGG